MERDNDYSGYETDDRILEAIEAITAGNLRAGGDEPDPDDPAQRLWENGGTDYQQALIAQYLDLNYPDWDEDGPLPWGLSSFAHPDGRIVGVAIQRGGKCIARTTDGHGLPCRLALVTCVGHTPQTPQRILSVPADDVTR